MVFVRVFLKCIIALIYGLSAAVVLYFPLAELAVYVSRETRLFDVPSVAPIEDALLPLFFLAIAYMIAALIRRKIDTSTVTRDSAAASEND